MSVAVAGSDLPLEWAVHSRPRAGQGVSGDLGLVRVEAGGAMVAAIDGLGHGAEAVAAARVAADVVAGTDARDVMAVMHACHEALAGTRGAAVTLAWLSVAARTMSWVAIGDVDGRLLRGGSPGPADAALLLPGGVAGHDLPTLLPETLDVVPGDVLVLATDGVDGDFADGLELAGPVEGIAERILRGHWDRSDDALVVVLRWLPDGRGAR